ncbi:MAG: acyl-CoA thioesterase [Psychroflexus halocasei]|uniref:acyl-CoA thioesterase n=1 Tax=Psychroflexus sp. S27 TaxID=1982757 RepID=UPI000C2A57DA|nr:thioesterase family protein [Psychroflexus sp. S27]PJX28476.1 thioesterase [Psychroflexus sp. S27]
MLKETQTPIEVRYAETDQMQIVHHSNYAIYFEQARVDWLRKQGMQYDKLEKEGVMLPLIKLEVNYKKPTVFGDKILVKTFLEKIPSVKISFDYFIYNDKNELLTKGKTVHAFVSSETRRPMRCPQSILDLLSD